MKNILYAASECGPFIKTGGLGSVMASLPRELDKEKYDVRIVIPEYQCIPREYKERMEEVLTFPVQLNWRQTYATVKKLSMEGETFYFLGHPDYFQGAEPYGDIWMDIEKYCGNLLSGMGKDDNIRYIINHKVEEIYKVQYVDQESDLPCPRPSGESESE